MPCPGVIVGWWEFVYILAIVMIVPTECQTLCLRINVEIA